MLPRSGNILAALPAFVFLTANKSRSYRISRQGTGAKCPGSVGLRPPFLGHARSALVTAEGIGVVCRHAQPSRHGRWKVSMPGIRVAFTFPRLPTSSAILIAAATEMPVTTLM
jgi:hypothetical protein